MSIKSSTLSPSLCDCWTPALLPHRSQSSIILIASIEGLGFFSWINQNIFSDSLPDYYHSWCEEHFCMWSREIQSSSMQVSSGPGTKTCIGIKPENSMHYLCPTETWLECKEGNSGGKAVNFGLYLGVLPCCSVQAAKTAAGCKNCSCWAVNLCHACTTNPWVMQGPV